MTSKRTDIFEIYLKMINESSALACGDLVFGMTKKTKHLLEVSMSMIHGNFQ